MVQRQKISRVFIISVFVILLHHTFHVQNESEPNAGRTGHTVSADPLQIYHEFRTSQTTGRLGMGVMFFTYGRNEKTLINFAKQAASSANQFRHVYPELKLALATSRTLDVFDGIFDHVILVAPEHDFPGSNYQKRPDQLERQWLTRILYLTASPFELTIAYDSNVAPCPHAKAALQALQKSEFDFAVASVGAKSSLSRHAFPHNFAMAFRWNAKVSSLFDDWFAEQVRMGVSRDDQNTLFTVLQKRRKDSDFLIRTLSPSVAFAFVSTKAKNGFYPRESRVISGPVAVIHEDPRHAMGLCEQYNRDAGRKRQIVKKGHSDNITVVFSPLQCKDTLQTSCKYSSLWDDLGDTELVPHEKLHLHESSPQAK